MVDNNNQYVYSRIVKIDNRDKITTIVNIRPNPAKQFIDIVIQQTQDITTATVETIDMLGRVLDKRNISIGSSDFTYRLPVSQLPTGTYSVKLICNNNVSVKQFIKD
jgi:hypothetical protein